VRRADRPIASNMKDPLQRLFLREKPSLAVLALSEMEPAYAAQIAKHIDSVSPSTHFHKGGRHATTTGHPSLRGPLWRPLQGRSESLVTFTRRELIQFRGVAFVDRFRWSVSMTSS